MAVFPQKPRSGEKVLQGLYNSVCQIIDYLPTLVVRGDNSSTSVTQTSNGTIVHASNNNSKLSQNKNYIGYHGVGIQSNKWIYCTLTGGNYITISYYEQDHQDEPGYELEIPIVDCTLSGGRYIQITPEGVINYTGPSGGSGGEGYTYVGDGDLGSGHIFVDYTPQDNPIICSNLVYIDNLLNYPIASSSFPTQKDLNQPVDQRHFMQLDDMLGNRGDNTVISIDYGKTTTWVDDPDYPPDSGHKIRVYRLDGIKVDCVLTGGRYIKVNNHWQDSGGSTPAEQEPDNHDIDCLLYGDRDIYPLSSYIRIVPYEIEAGLTGGIISTILHAGSGIAIDPSTGEISCTGGGGGTTIVASGLQYPNYSALYNSDNGSVSGLGISFILPVSAGQEYKYYTDARDQIQNSPGSYKEYAFATYAPSEGETGDSRREINNGEEFVPSANGWVRISVFDDGKHEGRCLRFYKGADTDYQYSTPLYRFHGFTNYQAGAGIAINSGIICSMIQTDRNDYLSGITSAGLYGGNPYNPTLTGIAIGLSSSWAENLAKISSRTKNKVLSSNASNQLEWTTLTLPEPVSNDLKAPDYTKLKLTEDTTNYSGMGTTYLVPISKGKRLKVEGTTVVARWAPVEGSTNVNAITLGSSYSTATTTDGYVRVTVMDDGSRNGECVRLYVSGANYAGELPLHRYSTALSGAAGIMVENGGIRNMIQPGDGLTSSALMTTGANPVMTGIAFNLSSQFVTDLTSISGRLSATTNEDRILSSHNGTLSWEENTASYTPPSTVYNMLAQGSGIQLTKLSDGTTKIDCTVQGGGGGSTGGVSWPNYANLVSGGSNNVFAQKTYTASSTGGWLRISCKGNSGGCCCIYINGVPQGKIGMWQGGNGTGNTWILPIPPGNTFYIEFPQSVLEAYFDSTCYDGDSYDPEDPSTWEDAKSSQEQEDKYYQIIDKASRAYRETFDWEWDCAQEYCSKAEGQYYEAEDNWSNWPDYPDDFWDKDEYYYKWDSANDYANEADTCATKAEEYANQASGLFETLTGVARQKSQDYVTSAINCSLSAREYANQASEWALSCKWFYDNYPS